MRKFLNLMIPLFCYIISSGQKTISGFVKDGKSLPVVGASISLKDTYDGATTDSSGRFSFATTEKGKLVLLATAIGYKAFEQPVQVDSSFSLSIILRQEVSELKAVVISAGSFEAGDRKKGTVLNSIDILTTADVLMRKFASAV